MYESFFIKLSQDVYFVNFEFLRNYKMNSNSNAKIFIMVTIPELISYFVHFVVCEYVVFIVLCRVYNIND